MSEQAKQIGQSLEYLAEIEFENAVRKEDKESPLLDDEQLDRLRLCVKLLTNIQTNLGKLEDGPIKVRFNQFDAITKFIEFIENAGEGDRLGYFQQPTGAGKTILMAILAKLCSVKTLFLVPRGNLLEQTVEALEKAGFDKKDIGIVGNRKFQTGKNITVCTYQSLPRLMQEGENGYEFVVCDEAHRGIGEETIKRFEEMGIENEDSEPEDKLTFDDIKNYVPQKAMRVGFTATPNLKNKKVSEYFRKLIHSITFAELIKAKILVKFKLVHTEGTVYDNDISDKEISREDEIKILEREQIYEKLIHKYLETCEKTGKKLKTAVFCANNNECKKFQDKADGYGLKSAIVTAKETQKNPHALKQAEAAMMRGEIDFIITVEKLGEGWDFPPLEGAILARATLSPVRIIQPIGRAARSYTDPEGNEKKYAYVFETEWKRMKGRNDKKSDPPVKSASERNPADGADVFTENTRARRKPLSVAQSLINLGESDIEEICENADGEELEYESYTKAPEGWVPIYSLPAKLGTDSSNVYRWSAKAINTHGREDWIKMYLNENDRPFDYCAPELLAILEKKAAERPDPAPDGWKNIESLIGELQASRHTIEQIADTYRTDHPEWFHYYAGKNNNSVEHFAPELIEIIRVESAKKMVSAPAGWISSTDAKTQLGVTSQFLQKSAQPYLATTPDQSGKFRAKNGKLVDYYHPDIIASIKKEMETRPEVAPEGWVTIGSLMLEIKSNDKSIKRIANPLIAANPALTKKYLDKTNREFDYYSPELAAVIRKTVLSQRENKPADGWKNLPELRKEFGVSDDFLIKIAKENTPADATWSKEYTNISGWTSTYYSPELIEIMEAKVKERPESAPPGWMTKTSLEKKLKKKGQTIEKAIEEQRLSNPERFKMYLDKGNHPSEHLSPEAVEYITQKVNEAKNS